MPSFLPLFPLELVAFPGETVNLHVFEPRYKELFGECETQGLTFGICGYASGRLAEFGTEMRLAEVINRYPGGELDVRTEGHQAFRLERFIREVPDKQYSGGDVTPIENDEASYPVSREELIRVYNAFHELIASEPQRDDFSAANLSFVIGHEVGLSLAQKVALLAMPKEADRQLMLVQHLHELIPAIEAAEETRKRIKRNGHFHKSAALDL